jgi:hypothetical protein
MSEQKGVETDATKPELPIWHATTDPPIDYTSQRLQSDLSSAPAIFDATLFCHSFEHLESFKILHWAALYKQRQGRETIRNSARCDYSVVKRRLRISFRCSGEGGGTLSRSEKRAGSISEVGHDRRRWRVRRGVLWWIRDQEIPP